MPSLSSKVQLSTSAKNSNIVLADIDRIKGAFKVYSTAESMNSTSINYFSDGQIVYVEIVVLFSKQQLLQLTLQTHSRILYPFQLFLSIVVHLLVHLLMEQIHLRSLENKLLVLQEFQCQLIYQL